MTAVSTSRIVRSAQATLPASCMACSSHTLRWPSFMEYRCIPPQCGHELTTMRLGLKRCSASAVETGTPIGRQFVLHEKTIRYCMHRLRGPASVIAPRPTPYAPTKRRVEFCCRKDTMAFSRTIPFLALGARRRPKPGMSASKVRLCRQTQPRAKRAHN
jgi:hypothetical protein